MGNEGEDSFQFLSAGDDMQMLDCLGKSASIELYPDQNYSLYSQLNVQLGYGFIELYASVVPEVLLQLRSCKMPLLDRCYASIHLVVSYSLSGVLQVFVLDPVPGFYLTYTVVPA